jgi:protein disulfide-isomerase A6
LFLQSLSAQFSKYAKFGEVKKENVLSAKYGVDSYPALFVIPPGGTDPKKYSGEMNPDAIKSFIKSLIPNYKEDAGSSGSSGSREKPQPPPKKPSSPQGDFNVKLTAQNFDSLVLNSDSVWMVEFFAPWCGHCKSLAPEWQKAADSMKGTVKFGAVDATVETSLASRYKIEGYPTIKVFPALKENKQRRVEDYRGQRTAGAISTYAAQQLPDLVSAFPLPQMPQWVQNNAAGLPTFVLVTSKDSTPTLLKSLALDFKGKVRIGAVLSADKQTLDQITGGPSELTLPALFAITKEGAQAYRGPLGMGPLSDFIRHFLGGGSDEAGPSTHGSPAAPEKGIAALDSQDAFESACLKRLGLCVVAFPSTENGAWESESAFQAYEQTAEKLKARPYHFMWADREKQKEFADAFRLPDDGSIGLVALHPGKKRFAVFVGVFDAEGITEFVDNLSRGKIPTSSYSSLPALQSDLSFDQAANNSTSTDETAFEADEDTGKCSSKPDDDSGTCSMPPKDEL